MVIEYNLPVVNLRVFINKYNSLVNELIVIDHIIQSNKTKENKMSKKAKNLIKKNLRSQIIANCATSSYSRLKTFKEYFGN